MAAVAGQWALEAGRMGTAAARTASEEARTARVGVWWAMRVVVTAKPVAGLAEGADSRCLSGTFWSAAH